MSELKENYVLIEDRDIYNGWCAKYYPDEHRIEWRVAWFTNKLTEEFKRGWVIMMLQQMKK